MKTLLLLLLTLTLNSYKSTSKDTKIKEGHWRTELFLNKKDTLPFSFYYYSSSKKIVIINASERIELKDIEINGDIISVKFPIFNSKLIGRFTSKKIIEGFWHNDSKGTDYKIPFKSVFSDYNRFFTEQTNADAFTGKWEATFNYSDKNHSEKAIGLFEEILGTIHGTFLTETGDYRFLGGISYGNKLKLSCFDGSHAFLFKAELKEDTLWGSFFSGKHYNSKWYAVRNSSFELRDPEKLTYVVNDSLLQFSFKDLNSIDYNYPNKTLKNKVVLLQILGTWCPNCMDETNFLTSIYSKYREEIEIIAVGFETGKTEKAKLAALRRYKNHMGIDYPILLGGEASKTCAVKLFPMLNNVISFPTLLIIDKKGDIRKIHTGFCGPSTGKYYTDFVENTTRFIEQLIAE